MKKIFFLKLLKDYFLLLIFFFPLISVCQKNNYNRHIDYNDEYLDKILNAESYITSNSDYLLYGNIKSIFLQRTADNELNNSIPYKSFFDENRNVIKSIIYRDGLEYINAEYYHESKYGGNPVYKSFYEYFNGELIKQIKSEIDTLNHIIINNHLSDGKITETDTILYTKDYKPLSILKYDNYKSLESVYKADYLENGKIYKYAYKRGNSSSYGKYIRYNEFGKPLYSYNIDIVGFYINSIDYEDSTKIKQYEFLWKDDKDFELREGTNKVTFFNFKEKKLHTKDKESTYTTFFNDDLLPVKKLSVDKKYNLNMEITYEYNNHNDLTLTKVKNEGSTMQTTTYKYVYDSKNNWVERKEYLNNRLVFTTKREIEYY